MDWTWGWPAVEAIATGVASLIVIGGIAFVFQQIREARRSTNAQLAVELFRELRSKESKDTLSRIYRLSSNDIKNLYKSTDISTKYLKNRINSLLDRFEMLGSLVNRKIVDKSLAIEAFGGAPALRCWYKLVGYIRTETDKRGSFLPNYEAFTRVCLDYFNKECITINFYCEETEDGEISSVVNLTELFKLDLSCRPRSLEKIKQERDC